MATTVPVAKSPVVPFKYAPSVATAIADLVAWITERLAAAQARS